MPEEKSSPGIIELCKQELHELYEFHEQENPGNFLRNHTNFLLAVTAGKVNRYILVPLVGFQTFRDGIGNHMKETVVIGGLEITFFILFSAYFGRIQKGKLFRFITQEGITKTTGRIGLGYAKGRVLGYVYLYKLAMIFAETHPQLYHSSVKYSILVQNVLRGIL